MVDALRKKDSTQPAPQPINLGALLKISPPPSDPAPSRSKGPVDGVDALPRGGVLKLRAEVTPAKPKNSNASTTKAADIQAKSKEAMKTFDGKVSQIKNHPKYKALSEADRKMVDESIAVARTRPNLNYYADKMLQLFNTPDAPPADTATMNNSSIDASKQSADARLATPAGKADKDKEEDATKSKSRNWTTLKGDTATYRVDRSDPKNVHVHMKVKLSGNKDDVARAKAMEDEIEKKAATKGYTLDIEFVDSSGPDVFEANVDPSKWTDSGNWAGAANELAHEAHHRLGLDDRYDYVAAHAGNADMKMETRIYWFHEQMKKTPDPAGKDSIMGDGSKMLDDDVCNVIQAPDKKSCESSRKRTTGVR